uniref:Predicted protein n=1 Tax=Hordeum vulgare subsp. vulgare TaxID=112509 RepID=F2EEH2_HORVV|nr:predicted protein [Hordeum vulgare subsp. vulgare]
MYVASLMSKRVWKRRKAHFDLVVCIRLEDVLLIVHLCLLGQGHSIYLGVSLLVDWCWMENLGKVRSRILHRD